LGGLGSLKINNLYIINKTKLPFSLKEPGLERDSLTSLTAFFQSEIKSLANLLIFVLVSFLNLATVSPILDAYKKLVF
jgi:hypothetical protein